MRKLIFIFSLVFLGGCAGQALKKEMLETRGYSQSDYNEIEKYRTEYTDVLVKGHNGSSAINSAEKLNAENRIKKIYCACIVKLGEKCRQKPEKLSKEEKIIWNKGNAAELALTGIQALNDPFTSKKFFIDDSECTN